MKQLIAVASMVLLSGCAVQNYSVDSLGMSWYLKGKEPHTRHMIIKTNHMNGDMWKLVCEKTNPCYWEKIINIQENEN